MPVVAMAKFSCIAWVALLVHAALHVQTFAYCLISHNAVWRFQQSRSAC